MTSSKRTLILSISLLGVFMLAIVGITYAYIGYIVKGNQSPDPSMDLQTGYLSIKYADGTSSLNTEGSTITGGTTLTKTFSVENTGVGTAFYSVWFRDVENPFVRTQDWTYVLKSGDTIISSGTVPTKDEVIVSARALNVRATDKLTLTVTYARTMENQIEDMNKTLEFNIGVNRGVSSFDTAEEGTLLYEINKITYPKNGPQSYKTDLNYESAEDNYGTSYYFSGNKTNNYVNYGGMCWRIVRIQGDGSIKLVLADENNLCNSGYSVNNKMSSFINNATPVSYDSDGVAPESLSFESSDILVALKTWETKIANSSNLVTTKWCNDMTNVSGENGVLNYGAFTRINNSLPSLKCKETFEDTIGILSADEVLLAGAQVNGINSYYLVDNANGPYWTMSPYIFDNTPNILGVSENGTLSNVINVTRSDIYVRPAIVLAKTTTVSGGNGSINNPYIIN